MNFIYYSIKNVIDSSQHTNIFLILSSVYPITFSIRENIKTNKENVFSYEGNAMWKQYTFGLYLKKL